MDANKIYDTTLVKLRALIVGHVCPLNGRASLKAFCEAYNVSRQNLQEVFAGRQDMSLGLFLRITNALTLVSSSQELTDPELLNMSLRLYLKIQPEPMLRLVLVSQE
jgi:hypothetical protein